MLVASAATAAGAPAGAARPAATVAGAGAVVAAPEPAPASGRPRLALALSGGGARGFSHIGTLKLLDSLGVRVDAIAGTSMGGIVGGLYAVGYSGRELEDLVLSIDWLEMFTDSPPRSYLTWWERAQSGRHQVELGVRGTTPSPPSGLLFGRTVSATLARLVWQRGADRDFDRLPVPFRCVAIDLVSGRTVVLGRGSLARALRATMAIPTIFSPVAWGDSLLIDGGTADNLPVDVARNMGADAVIACDVTKRKSREDLDSALAVMSQWVSNADRERYDRNIADADLVIRPVTAPFHMADFTPDRVRRILRAGDAAAREALPALVALLDSLGIRHGPAAPDTAPRPAPPDRARPAAVAPPAEGSAAPGAPSPRLHAVTVKGNRHQPAPFILQQLDLQPGDVLDLERLERRQRCLYGLGYFEQVDYEVRRRPDGRADVIFTVKELPRQDLRLGLRYDDQHKVVLLVGLHARNRILPGLLLSGELQMLGLTRIETRGVYAGRSQAWPVAPFLSVAYRDVSRDLFDAAGNRSARFLDRGLTVTGGIDLVPVRWLRLEAALAIEALNIDVSVGPDAELPSLDAESHLRQLRLDLALDTLDDVLLPERGWLLEASYEGGLAALDSDLEYERGEIALDRYLALGDRHVLRLHGYWGEASPGTPVFKLPDQGRPDAFVGVEFDQLRARRLSVARVDYRYRFRELLQIGLILNVAPSFRFWDDGTDRDARHLRGWGIGVTFLTPLGPLELVSGQGRLDLGAGVLHQQVLTAVFGARF